MRLELEHAHFDSVAYFRWTALICSQLLEVVVYGSLLAPSTLSFSCMLNSRLAGSFEPTAERYVNINNHHLAYVRSHFGSKDEARRAEFRVAFRLRRIRDSLSELQTE